MTSDVNSGMDLNSLLANYNDGCTTADTSYCIWMNGTSKVE